MMPPLTIGWEYLTGYAVATDPSSRDRAEWPPHPGRLFMALAAAWFETAPAPGSAPEPATGKDVFHEPASQAQPEYDAEGDALRWLETLGDPELHLPPTDRVFERSVVTVFVPVNDKAGPAASTLQSAPAITRGKQPRTFPRVWVGRDPCYMVWPDADGLDGHRVALARLCGKVTRIGHSSSLVRMWLAEKGESVCTHTHKIETWIPDDGLADRQVRGVSCGTLDMLMDRFNEPERARHAELIGQIDALTAQKKTVKGQGSKDRKGRIAAQIASLQEQTKGINPPPPLRPSLGLWSGYRRDRGSDPSEVPNTHFDTDVLVLTHVGGPVLPLVSTLAVTRVLRETVMSRSRVQPVPEWVSGHEPDGQPLRDDAGHLACVPLPFVGREHADGHLLGVGLVFPRSVERRERGRVLGKLLLDNHGQPKQVELKMDRLGVWKLQKRDWSDLRLALQPETWTAHPRGTDTWASVTPVVLDRFPKTDHIKDRAAWTSEVIDIIATACKRIDLPKPVGIDIDTTSWHLGSPRAVVKQVRLRGQASHAARDHAPIGDGFPHYPMKGTNAHRPQLHVWLRFSEPVVGPVLLGAGRYLGYGLCKPWKEGRR